MLSGNKLINLSHLQEIHTHSSYWEGLRQRIQPEQQQRQLQQQIRLRQLQMPTTATTATTDGQWPTNG